ncbi:uncharacterized protein LOC128883144 isoform X2 [Hylaeus volcanicus]|uniref:uncharacterized protein LOC128883144 isoform X2 n=1 Tax=Hylaeus volcanicus TaxID=313075 RepID=UPI0023B80F82|nr:uncharacterized protein LOC128883144 isoform X2 [Hylaeus volcanicus]
MHQVVKIEFNLKSRGSLMASNENTIDWAKAAATWVSQKHDGTQKKSVPENVRPQQPVVPFHTIPERIPVGSYGTSGVYPMPYNAFMNTRAPGTNLILPLGGHPHSSVGTTPPTNLFVNGTNMNVLSNGPPAFPFPGLIKTMQPRLGESFFFNGTTPSRSHYGTMVPGSDKSGAFPTETSFSTTSSTVPASSPWIKEGPKPTGFPDASTNTTIHGDLQGDMENQKAECKTLNAQGTFPMKTIQQESDILQQGLVSSTFQTSRHPDTEAYVPTISAGPVSATSLIGKPRTVSLASPNPLLPMVRHPSMPGVPSQILHPSVQQSLMLGGAPSNPPLHLQFSMTFRRSYGPPVPDPTLEPDEEILDEREAYDNGGLPFFTNEELKKGLFRSPPDGVTLPLSEPVNKEEINCHSKDAENTKVVSVREYPGPYVKVVSYSREGQILGSILLNKHSCLVFGSNPKQAHIIDSHTSVYSQHCAMAVCYKGKTSTKSVYQPCALYIFSLGGSTKLLKPEQVPFFCQKENEETALKQGSTEENPSTNTVSECVISSSEEGMKNEVPQVSGEGGTKEEEQGSVLPLPKVAKPGESNEAIEMLTDAGRRREIPLNSQLFVQLSGSRRYYLIDATYFNVVSVRDEDAPGPKFRFNGVKNDNEPEDLVEVENVKANCNEQHRPHESKSKRESRSSSDHASMRRSRRHSSRSNERKYRSTRDKHVEKYHDKKEQRTSRGHSVDKYSRHGRYSSHSRHARRSVSPSPRSSRYRDSHKSKRQLSRSPRDYNKTYDRRRR